MSKNYVELIHELDRGEKAIARQSPEVGAAIRGLVTAASKGGALDTRTKELMALAVGIAAGCDSAIAFHTRNALRAGATKAEVADTAGVALEAGGWSVLSHAAGALDAYDQFVQEEFSSEKVD